MIKKYDILAAKEVFHSVDDVLYDLMSDFLSKKYRICFRSLVLHATVCFWRPFKINPHFIRIVIQVGI